MFFNPNVLRLFLRINDLHRIYYLELNKLLWPDRCPQRDAWWRGACLVLVVYQTRPSRAQEAYGGATVEVQALAPRKGFCGKAEVWTRRGK